MTTNLGRLIEAVEAGEGSRNDGTLYHLFGDSWVHAWDVMDRGSLDAAVALLGPLLPGWDWGRMNGRMFVEQGDSVFSARGPNPSRALLLATLRAYRSARDGQP